ncbi:MAG: class I SAM-dependent methyltransferase [Candidatus Saccharimonadales bacterium]
MTELTPEELNRNTIDRNYAETSSNVRARFEVYKHAVPYVGIERYAVDVLSSLGAFAIGDTVMDVGTADGSLHLLLRDQFGHKGAFIGLDPNSKQFEHLLQPFLPMSKAEWEAVKSGPKPVAFSAKSLLALHAGRPFIIFKESENLSLHEGRAHDLSQAEDKTINVLFAMFMLYHLPQQERQKAYAEFRRVLRPEGVLVCATSGKNNKFQHRRLESEVASYLGIQPPSVMNASFTTESSGSELAADFEHVYEHSQHALFSSNTREKIEVYLASLRSLRDQFEPIPESQDFETALIEKVLPQLTAEDQYGSTFTDTVHRSIFFASSHPLQIAERYDFRRVN